jgi:hypothetical protein
MRIRALDINGDWTFGKGQNNYLTKNAAIGESIQTRLLSFLGDCFFDLGAGLDWFTFLGGDKDQLTVGLAISAVILNTQNVLGIRQLNFNLNETTRVLSIQYQVQTSYSVLSGAFQYDLAA